MFNKCDFEKVTGSEKNEKSVTDEEMSQKPESSKTRESFTDAAGKPLSEGTHSSSRLPPCSNCLDWVL